jgi:putative hydrolase of the HAD superfamily
MIRAIVFDLDDTLYPEREYVLGGFKAVDRWVASETGARGFFEEAWRLFLEGHRGTIFNEALLRMGVPFDDRFILEAVRVYREHPPEIRLFADAEWALIHFRQSAKMGLITDGHQIAQRKKIQALNIDSFFDEIIVTDEYGREHWKPSPFAYRRIMDAFRVQGHECVYIGDNPAKDFIAARQLGWRTVRVERQSGVHRHSAGQPVCDADAVIPDLYRLPEVLDPGKERR